MSGPVREPPQGRHSLSCTDLEWERIKSRARARGMSVSRFLVARALAVPEPAADGAAARGPLSAAERQEVLTGVREIAERLGVPDGASEPLADRAQKALAFLVAETMGRMLRTDRSDEILEIAGELFDAETLARTRAWVAKRTGCPPVGSG